MTRMDEREGRNNGKKKGFAIENIDYSFDDGFCSCSFFFFVKSIKGPFGWLFKNFSTYTFSFPLYSTHTLSYFFRENIVKIKCAL